MRVLIIHTYYQDFGGEDVVFAQESKLLAEQDGVLVETLTFQNQKHWKGLIQFAMSPWNIFAAQKLRKKIRSFRPDIIHIHNTQYASGPLLVRTAKRHGIPVFMSLHNYRLLCPSATLFHDGRLYSDSVRQHFPWKAVRDKVLDDSYLKTFWTAFSYWLHRRIGTWNMVDRYFVLAPFAKKLFLESTLNIDSEKFVVKPNFIELPEYSIEENIRGSHFIIVGRLSAEKGIIPLAKIFRKSAYTLKIAGEGPQSSELENIASQCDNIQLLGHLEKSTLITEIRRSKALIVPSVCYEGGVPLTAIEGFFAKTPIIVNAIGALDEAIIDGENGFKINLSDPKTVTQKLKTVANMESLCLDSIARAAYDSAKDMYSKGTVLKILISTYDQSN